MNHPTTTPSRILKVNTKVTQIIRDETQVLCLIVLEQLDEQCVVITAFIAGQAATQHSLEIGDYVFAGIEYLTPSVGRLASYQVYSPLAHADNLAHQDPSTRYINYTPTGMTRVDCYRGFYHVSRSNEQAACGQVALEGDDDNFPDLAKQKCAENKLE